MLQATDIRGVYGIIATPATADASRFDAVDTVDLAETERLTNALVADGVAGLIVLGTTGECATITEDEYRAFVDCFLSTVDGRVPTFVGATTMGAHQTVQRLKFARERGATGTILGLPMWQPCTTDMALHFYEGIAGEFPDLSIMVYGNTNAFRYDFPVEFWEALAKRVPTAVCAKYGQPAVYQQVLDATGGRINFMPMDSNAFAMAQVSQPTLTACWATTAGMGPQPAIAVMDAILAGDMERAEAISADLKWANETFMPPHIFPVFGSYNIQLEKLRIAAAGYCDPGPIRPPYDDVPADIAEGARECGRRWATLVEKYSAAT